MPAKSVCIIGAGPCGLSTLHALHNNKTLAGSKFVCYEVQNTIGGQWNLTWRTGVDKFGVPISTSMYKYLWSNGPKECLEMPDYTFRDHFKKSIPSYPPREVLAEYIKGRAVKENLEQYIKFQTRVQYVTFDDASKKFTVAVIDLPTQRTSTETFDYVIVCNGNFAVPNVPDFPGMDSFPGRVIHAHEFRDASRFKNQNLLVVGGSYSAEDVALQCFKYGAKSVTISYRTAAMGFHWPKEITEHPEIAKIEGSKITFKDGHSDSFDSIILATGYLHSYPFLEDKLRLHTPNVLYPPLYKGVVFPGNAQLLYVGKQDQYYTFTMFDVEGEYAAQVVSGEQTVPSPDECRKDIAKWVERMKGLNGWKDDVAFQTDMVMDLVNMTNYCAKTGVKTLDVSQLFADWENFKHDNILTYRDQSHKSIYTGDEGPPFYCTWLKAFDDSVKTFVDNKPPQ